LLLPDHPLTYFFVMTQLYGKKGIASSTFLKGCTFSKSWTFSVTSENLPYRWVNEQMGGIGQENLPYRR
ncbi:hypothetical protein, partial [Paenibacillus sp. MMS18-CY102]|uniref:hypothetical protein n=1 Tax=Paenibacillus sp. MMS18-CY102 TaxID=2682849 RepID=UPI001F1A6A05